MHWRCRPSIANKQTCQPTLMIMVNNWLRIVQDSLLPPTCILCANRGYDSQDICQPCLNSLVKNWHCCYRCASSFATATFKPQLCGHCISAAPAFDATHAPFLYHGALRHLITTLKFNAQYKNARLLGYLLAHYLQQSTTLPEKIIPVPLHRRRFCERGFNQSTEIAKAVAKQLKIPTDLRSASRIKNTARQTDCSAKQRPSNVKNAFSVNLPTTPRHVAIVDDVMTTGSTANELAKTLKKAGVARVDVWVCARA